VSSWPANPGPSTSVCLRLARRGCPAQRPTRSTSNSPRRRVPQGLAPIQQTLISSLASRPRLTSAYCPAKPASRLEQCAAVMWRHLLEWLPPLCDQRQLLEPPPRPPRSEGGSGLRNCLVPMIRTRHHPARLSPGLALRFLGEMLQTALSAWPRRANARIPSRHITLPSPPRIALTGDSRYCPCQMPSST